MLVFASLTVLVPLVISAVLAPAEAQTFEDIFAQFGKITPQLADTSIVATKPPTHDTCLASGSACSSFYRQIQI